MSGLNRLCGALAMLCSIGPAYAQPAPYTLDPIHTRVMFAVDHAGFSQAMGTVSGSTGELWFDPEDWSSARLQAHVPMDRIDLGDAKWNKATLGTRLLDVAKYPVATFVSTKVEAVDAQHAKVSGTLTLHGVARPITLDVTLNAARRHPMPPFRRTVGFSATTMLSRKEFGINAWSSMIGDQVELRIEVEAVRGRVASGRRDDGAQEKAQDIDATDSDSGDDASDIGADHQANPATASTPAAGPVTSAPEAATTPQSAPTRIPDRRDPAHVSETLRPDPEPLRTVP